MLKLFINEYIFVLTLIRLWCLFKSCLINVRFVFDLPWFSWFPFISPIKLLLHWLSYICFGFHWFTLINLYYLCFVFVFGHFLFLLYLLGFRSICLPILLLFNSKNIASYKHRQLFWSRYSTFALLKCLHFLHPDFRGGSATFPYFPWAHNGAATPEQFTLDKYVCIGAPNCN